MIDAKDMKHPLSVADALLKLIGTPDLCSKRWVWEQYDHIIVGNTVQRPGGDCGVVRIEDGPKGLAMTCDVTPRYCEADPFEGGKQAVAEAYRNLSAVGALPLAVTDNLNFGNPERPEIMGQFVGCVRGISAACKALDFPVVSGNVSLYNETNGRAILPTPTIGGVGLLDDFTKSASVAFKNEGDVILLIGETQGWLGQSLYLRDVCGREEGAPPPVDLAVEKRNGSAIRDLIGRGLVNAAHDLSDGGLADRARRDGDGVGSWRKARSRDVAKRTRLLVRRGSGPLCRDREGVGRSSGDGCAARAKRAGAEARCRRGQGHRDRRRDAGRGRRSRPALRILAAGLHGGYGRCLAFDPHGQQITKTFSEKPQFPAFAMACLQPGDSAAWLSARHLTARPWPICTPLHSTLKSLKQ